MHKVHQRRFVRYSLLALNVVLLGGIVWFVAQSTPSITSSANNTASSANGAVADPLDQLSSADIAVNMAKMTALPEITAVTNQADSVGAELAVPPAHTTVISKPQAVATDLKSRKDIKTYIVQAGDTIASIAAKFNVTSESISWSNNVTGNTVAPGTKLVIPPVNGIVYTVAAGDTADSIAAKYRANKEQIIAYNDAELGGLTQGMQIIIPNGQQPAPVVSSRGGAYGFSGGSFTAAYGYNGYDFGFCTWYVAKVRAEIGRPLPSNLGNAATWDDRAAAAGLNVTKTPSVGAAVVTSQRGAGHVAFVEKVNPDGSIWVSEMNSRGQRSMTDPTPAGGWNKRDYKLIPADKAATYNYIR